MVSIGPIFIQPFNNLHVQQYIHIWPTCVVKMFSPACSHAFAGGDVRRALGGAIVVYKSFCVCVGDDGAETNSNMKRHVHKRDLRPHERHCLESGNDRMSTRGNVHVTQWLTIGRLSVISFIFQALQPQKRNFSTPL